MRTSDSLRSVRRGVVRCLVAFAVAMGFTMVATPRAAYAIPSCSGSLGARCGSERACFGVPGGDTYICITRYYYWDRDLPY